MHPLYLPHKNAKKSRGPQYLNEDFSFSYANFFSFLLFLLCFDIVSGRNTVPPLLSANVSGAVSL